MLTHLLFAAFVALGVYAQSLTGFALALILLGLVGVTNLVPLPDAANVVTVIIIVNAAMSSISAVPPMSNGRSFRRWAQAWSARSSGSCCSASSRRTPMKCCG